ncbi:hypothetical protein CR970_01880 [Candidatus Saccharibacteria bacterium]|nr:MAG: hypothetical protein CR970_01880 [Candidatus Saccharibacteria bacterium]
MYATIDIGGTKTLITVFTAHGEAKESVKFPTPRDYDQFKSELSAALQGLEHHDFQAACVAAPGRIDHKNGVAMVFGNLPWVNAPIQADVESVLHCPAILENDAKLAALSEALLVRDQYRKVLYVTISTGIGGGLVIDGQIDPDFDSIEIGQMLLEYDGELRRWEEFASGKAFQAKYNMRVGDMPDDNNGAWYWFARNIAIGMVHLAATLAPEVIIVGGGAGGHLDKFQERLAEQLKIYETPLLTMPPIQVAKRPEEAVVYGCYDLARMRYGHHQ